MLKKTFIVVALVSLLLCVGGQKSGATVTVKNLAFSPETVRVKVGETVTWVNADDRDHTVNGPGMKSGNIKPGKSWSTSFSKPGSFSYGCQYHPRMRGTVVVSE